MNDYEIRFGGIRRLFGKDGQERLRKAHVCVIGLGGVGSWAVESLARSGVGELTLVDVDDVCPSNTNRQLHALDGEYGKPKADVMAKRVLAINPECRVHPAQLFFTYATAEMILSRPCSYVMDAIDSPAKKAFLISECRFRNYPVITSGGAGGRRDPAAVRISEIAFTTHDRLLLNVRRLLRGRYEFPRGNESFNIPCVHAPENPEFENASGGVLSGRPEPHGEGGDSLKGFGTASFVTGVFGLMAAGYIVREIAANRGGELALTGDVKAQGKVKKAAEVSLPLRE